MDGARAASPPPHVVLRESTRAAHEAAEASPAMQRLLAGALDEAGYRELLAAQWGLLSDWEARHAGWLARDVADAGWHVVSRVERLAFDLEGAGLAALAAPTGSRQPVVGAAIAASGATAWGELYVIEGSALGGRVIVKRLRERFPSLPHHFYAIGENADEPWRRFQAVLDRVLADPDALQAAIDGALRMFARFQQTLQDDAAHV